MIMCRQVSRALLKNHYWELPWYRRIPMFIHIKCCMICGKYNRQVIDFQKGVNEYLAHEKAGDIEPQLKLSEDARKRIALSMKQEK